MLPLFQGKIVRLTCKVVEINLEDEILVVEASDGGEVKILNNRNVNVKDPIIEVVGKVVGERCVAMASCVNLGKALDLKLVDDTIKLIHDPRFFGKLF
ncbi:hypothetical protein CVT26_011806 [Gymnopilus dilepis]|uniref:Replication factor A protein 3 n=1 Tax=Gymnopilus dilepis TaxID=231916 RepID=A0A409WC92_9AGAR|nr:hypothetical protein CVT26_011806 [Gymnopilus dilepis]